MSWSVHNSDSFKFPLQFFLILNVLFKKKKLGGIFAFIVKDSRQEAMWERERQNRKSTSSQDSDSGRLKHNHAKCQYTAHKAIGSNNMLFIMYSIS